MAKLFFDYFANIFYMLTMASGKYCSNLYVVSKKQSIVHNFYFPTTKLSLPICLPFDNILQI